MIRLLPRPEPMHDVADIEALIGRVLDRRLDEWSAELDHDQYESAHTFLLDVAWQLSSKYDRTRGLSFSTYCYRLCRLRLADWYRGEFYDSRYGPACTDCEGAGKRGDFACERCEGTGRLPRPDEISLEQLLADIDQRQELDIPDTRYAASEERVLTAVATGVRLDLMEDV